MAIRKPAKRTWLLAALAVIMVGAGLWPILKEKPAGKASDQDALQEQVKLNGDTLEIAAGPDKWVLQVAKPDLLRVNFMPNGESDPDTPVIGKPEWKPVGAAFDLKADPMTITTAEMKVQISKKDVAVSVYDKRGRLLVSQQPKPEEAGGVTLEHESGDTFYGINGYRAGEPSQAGMVRNASVGTIEAGAQGDAGGPLVWSSKGYGVLFDTDKGRIILSDTKINLRGNSKRDAEYYVAVGDPAAIMASVADISGKPPIFPKWAMGFFNSEWGMDQKELLQIVDTYRNKQIPIDNITLDFDWKAWSEDHYGEFRWNGVKFPDGPSGKLKEILDSKGIKLTGILKPRIHTETEQGRLASEKGWWWPKKPPYNDYFSRKQVNDLNFALPEVRTWFFDHLKKAFDTGIVAWWNDEADEGYDNLQFLNMQRGLYEGQREYANKRVWSINRNFFLGAQRYAYAMWSGDIGTGFKNMASQRERLLSAVNVGQVKWGMDSGGFSGDPSPENYARWIQFSAFTPVFRVHGTLDKQRQPWVYGEKAEKAATEAIRLRYSLIPYIYSYERRAYETGIGLVKPLFYDYPNDPKTANDIDAWMFGEGLLVSPVVAEGQQEKEIYLPEGTWIDYFKGTVYKGGQSVKLAVDSETWRDIPLFVRKGAIIPTQDVMNYVGEKPADKIDVDVFPDTKKTEFSYYDDDGNTYDYEKGVYYKQLISARDDGTTVQVELAAPEGQFKPETKFYLFKIHGAAGKTVRSGSADLQRVDGVEALVKASGEAWTAGKDVYGDVTYVKIAAGSAKQMTVQR